MTVGIEGTKQGVRPAVFILPPRSCSLVAVVREWMEREGKALDLKRGGGSGPDPAAAGGEGRGSGPGPEATGGLDGGLCPRPSLHS